MKTPEEKRQMIRDQVISKIHWGAREQEVTTWLEEKHGIVGSEAQSLLTEAYRCRSQAVRGRALIRLICSLLGIVLVVAFIYVRFLDGYIFVGPRSLFATMGMLVLGGYSIRVFIRSAARLLTGKVPGSVD